MASGIIRKPIILTFARYYLPGYKSGGQLRTLCNMVELLGDELDFRIVTSDRDLLDMYPYEKIEYNCWQTVGKAKVYYVANYNQSYCHLVKLINSVKYDIIYLNSVFDSVFTLLPLLYRRVNHNIKPYVIAPRGEFSKSALSLKKLRKKVYLSSLKIAKIFNGLVWQASSHYEKEDICDVISKNCALIKVAPDLPSPTYGSGHILSYANGNKCLKLVYLSRVTPKKYLDFALRILKKTTMTIEYDIYGPIDDYAFWDECNKIIATLPKNVQVNYKGSIAHEKVFETLSQYDLFFFPTSGENYGHVIFEALASGLPVLISDQTPWRDLAKEGIGWDIPLENEDVFLMVIDKFMAMNFREIQEMRIRAYNYAKRIVADNNTLDLNLRLFMELVE